MGVKKLSQAERTQILRLYGEGLSQIEISRMVGRSPASIHTVVHSPQGTGIRAGLQIPAPLRYHQLSSEARRAHDDFDYFSARYLAREATPFRRVVSRHLVDALADTQHRTFLIVAAPPGVGKTSLAEDLVIWSLIRNRGLRALLGSATLNRAEDYLRFCKGRMEATSPFYDHVTKRQAEGSWCTTSAGSGPRVHPATR